MKEWIQTLIEQVRMTSWMEWTSTVTQIASVFFAQRNNVWVYPTGIIGVLIAAYLYFFVAHPPLYAEGSVHIYYFGMSCYGWYLWTQKQTNLEWVYPISRSTKKEMVFSGMLGLVSWAIIFILLNYFTNSDTPWLDSFVSATAITAMWLMASRKIENWLFWILSNIVAIPLHVFKSFYLFAFMFMIFLIMAVVGYFKWKKKLVA